MSSSSLSPWQLLQRFSGLHTPNYLPHRVNLVKGSGSLVEDSTGKEYIDLAGGIAVSALGHRHPALVDAATQAAQSIWHLSNYWTNEPAMRLAQGLCDVTFAERVFFANSGAEANEAALKLARKFARDTYGEGKHTVLACDNSFHGRTLFTSCVTGQAKYNLDFAPLPPGIDHIPFNDIAALEQALDDSCCCLIVEPVQGEGGVIPIDPAFARRARDLCTEHGALLIFDEIQSGMGRTGCLFAYQGLETVPDILTSAKALGCGLPIGAMLTTSRIAKHLTPGSHGSTCGGNPFVTRVAASALSEISRPQLLAQVKQSGELATTQLGGINHRLGCFRAIRQAGLLIGCELAPAWEKHGTAVIEQALNQGVMVLSAAGGKVVRLAPALNIPAELLVEGLNRLESALNLVRSL